jgi:hypothetical protein
VRTILDERGKADLVTATNVFAHVDDISALADSVVHLLKRGGAFVIEVPYLPEMLRSGAFDLVYHEHLSYFSVAPLVTFFASKGMDVFRVEAVATHGGSIRVFVQRAGDGHERDGSVDALLDQEAHLSDPATYAGFGGRVVRDVGEFASIVADLSLGGNAIAGYAAPAKASTLLGFARLDSSHLDYIVDDNPMKQGRYVPGTGIPIVSSAVLDKRPPDYLVILAWNLADAIIAKLGEYKNRGGQFIVPFSRD